MKSIAGIIERFKDGWSIGAAQTLVGKGQLSEARQLLYARWRSNGRPFPSPEASLPANATAASINYHLGRYNEAVDCAEAALAITGRADEADNDNRNYIIEFCKEIRSEVMDAGTDFVYKSTFFMPGLSTSNVSRRYLRYFPLRAGMKPLTPRMPIQRLVRPS